AASYYTVPIYTDDIDIIVLASTDSDYVKVYREINEFSSQTDTFSFLISGLKVQILPTSISDLYADSLQTAKQLKTEGITTRVVDKEHLILLALLANRPKDRYRVMLLIPLADRSYLNSLLRRFDSNGTLKKRLDELAK
ncbi:MAG: hypothetical protein AABZ77_06835, partial [Chloroflexota bacterium]